MGTWGNGTGGVRIRGAIVLAGLAAFGLAACGAEDAPTEPVGGAVVSDELLASVDLGSAISELTESLGLSDEQLAAIQGLTARNQGQGPLPGAAWDVAADLQEILTSDQIAELDSQIRAARDRVRMERGERSSSREDAGTESRSRAQSSRGMTHRGHGYAWLDLTEQQQERVRAILESHRAEIEALREEFGGSDLSLDEMRDRSRAVRAAIRDEIEALLTQEQQDRLLERNAELGERRASAMEWREQARQRGAAEHAAMVDALGLTDAQIEQMDALRENRGAHREAVGEILTDEQQEVVTLHRALIAHRFRAAGPESRGRGAGRRGGGEGQFGGTRVHGATST
jgi:hypothetical protein